MIQPAKNNIIVILQNAYTCGKILVTVISSEFGLFPFLLNFIHRWTSRLYHEQTVWLVSYVVRVSTLLTVYIHGKSLSARFHWIQRQRDTAKTERVSFLPMTSKVIVTWCSVLENFLFLFHSRGLKNKNNKFQQKIISMGILSIKFSYNNFKASQGRVYGRPLASSIRKNSRKIHSWTQQ